MKLPIITSSRCIGSLLSAMALLSAGAKAGGIPFNVLFQSDFSDHYITPRGLNMENAGLVYQPLLLTFWDLYSDKGGVLTDVSLTAGFWNSFHTEKSGAEPSHWNEFDPILGLTFSFYDFLKFETNYTAFDSMTDSYPTSQHLELKLKLDDSKWLGDFALNPYVAYWLELDNKATVTFNEASSDESYYFTLGINPSCKAGPVKIELPTYINLCGDNFYQQFDGSGGGSGLAVFGTEIKASTPLTCIPKEWGSWTGYVGVKYYHLYNDGLLDGNTVLAGGTSDDLFQFHTGISIFF